MGAVGYTVGEIGLIVVQYLLDLLDVIDLGLKQQPLNELHRFLEILTKHLCPAEENQDILVIARRSHLYKEIEVPGQMLELGGNLNIGKFSHSGHLHQTGIERQQQQLPLGKILDIQADIGIDYLIAEL